ncbi:translation initiation factor IF-2 [Candidatus Shapirobacteria bacterium]|nr:MAG: translation initiation factor IF-2 [Candidatus Shapirobacteria bacterium]
MNMKQQKKTTFRPPIVTLMGHIDHGKTTLLDKIRSSRLWHKESGGITQHISAYQVDVSNDNKQPQLITFIDTPGHATFMDMRARGNSISDLVVLVVSATEGVKAQTKESIKLIKQSNTPVIVALNKVDLPTANLDKVRAELSEQDLVPEEFGGQIATIPLSAKTGEGIDKFLEVILLNAEIMELKMEDKAELEAIVIESRLDKQKGPILTAVVKKGILKLGDTIFIGQHQAKIKSLLDYNGQPISQAGPATPVQIMAFSFLPTASVLITSKLQALTTNDSQQSIDLPAKPDSAEKSLNIVVKADTKGTLEALLNNFTNNINIISSGVGPITDNDIFLAKNASAQIFAFNLNAPKFIRNLAKNENIQIFESQIIYEIIEEVQGQVLKMLEPTIDENILGQAVIKAEFNINKVRIAGLSCTKGTLSKGDKIHLKRGDEIIKDSRIHGIKQAKQEVDKIKAGQECGMVFKPYIDFKISDVIIAYNKN